MHNKKDLKKEDQALKLPISVKRKKTTQGNKGRVQIGEPVKRILWAKAAGRCEFQGCNKLLYKDDVTQQKHNGATIAHIVAYEPDGPRGDPVRSIALRQDLSNLMLTCKLHGGMIDDKAYVDQYTEEVLIGFKKAHEDRVRIATAAIDDYKTTVLLVQGRISGRKSSINQHEAQEAIKPRWPDSENPDVIDLNDFTIGEDRDAYWEACQDAIIKGVAQLMRNRSGREIPKHLSIFVLLPIPLLVLLGHEISSRIGVDLFQYHRDKISEKWCWNDGDPTHDDLLDTYEPLSLPEEQAYDAAIVVSITSIVDPEAVTEAVKNTHARYEIRARRTGTDFLKYRSQLSYFSAEYRRILNEIREKHRTVSRVHLFLAAPAPIAVEAGRQLIEKADPPVTIYEYTKPIYRPVLVINEKEPK